MIPIKQYHFTSLDSTNNWAKQHVQTFSLEDLTVITAEAQTAGRGRFDRPWISPAGKNLYLTFCFFIEKREQELNNIPQVLALSTASILERLGFYPKLKWPNDLLLSNKKAAGILCETVRQENGLAVILGLGLNINMSAEELGMVNRPATSLLHESGTVFSIETIKNELIQQFALDLQRFLIDGFSSFFFDFAMRFDLKKGDPIHIRSSNQELNGLFHSLKPDGSLVIQLDTGKLRTFYSGEII